MSKAKNSLSSILVPFSAPVPDYIRELAGKGTERIRPEDTAWLGEDGELEPPPICVPVTKLVCSGFDLQG